MLTYFIIQHRKVTCVNILQIFAKLDMHLQRQLKPTHFFFFHRSPNLPYLSQKASNLVGNSYLDRLQLPRLRKKRERERGLLIYKLLKGLSCPNSLLKIACQEQINILKVFSTNNERLQPSKWIDLFIPTVIHKLVGFVLYLFMTNVLK